MLKLEIFEETSSHATVSAQTVVLDRMDLEEAKLAAYDQGYQAGWDDATSSEADAKSHLGTELSQNLMQMSFTYHEVRSALLRSLEPLLTSITNRVLPQMASQGLGEQILEILRPLLQEGTSVPVHLTIHPMRRTAVEALLEQKLSLPLKVVEEASLGEGQAFLRLGSEEIKIDIDAAVAEIDRAIKEFFQSQTKE